MQLGTRWTARSAPPAAVPEELHAQLAAVEADLPPGEPLPRWTLTWLEGRPVVELDTGVVVSLDRTGAVFVRHDDDDAFA
ncbi:MAG: hypothetical protein ACK5IN_07535 [Microbacterium sp.]|uniref:hypothetical protein n=1 Tax=Microbacterium sp. TaxID=51671 RepID=UPI003A84704E